jgi:DNA-binding MarR family transcriptional regulator
VEGRAVGESPAGGAVGRGDVGFLLAKATQRWNELLAERFAAAGFADVRPSYGSALLPLFEEDGLRIGELARRARLSKQTLTTMVRRLESDGLVARQSDPADGRAQLVFLTDRARRFQPVAESALSALDQLVAECLGERRQHALVSALALLADLGSEHSAAGGSHSPTRRPKR